MAKIAEHAHLTARLIAMAEAAGLNPNDVSAVQLVHENGMTRVRFELYLTDAMAAALLGEDP